jgi:AraC family transcriptional regulator
MKALGLQMQFSLIASSDGRLGDGIDASLYNISAGISARPPNAAYTAVLHLSAPVEGSCRCDDRFVERVIKPGDIDFIPLGHAATWHDKGPGRVARISLSSAFIHQTANDIGARKIGELSFPSLLSLRDPVLQHLMLAIVAELESGGEDRLLAASLGTAMATRLLRRYARVGTDPHKDGLSRRQISRITEYIEANFAENLSHADIAALAGISPSRLKALFKDSFGMPVHQYVIRKRVEYAARLLSERGARICDIAQQAGFSDQSHMARFMRRVIGTTPAALLREFHR